MMPIGNDCVASVGGFKGQFHVLKRHIRVQQNSNRPDKNGVAVSFNRYIF